MHRHSPNLLLLVILILGGIVIGLVVIAGYQWVGLVWPQFVHSAQKLATLCQTMAHTIVASPIFPLLSAVLVVAGLLLWRLVVRPIQKIHTLRKQITTTHTTLTRDVSNVIQHLTIRPDQLNLIESDAPYVFCLGLFQPRIYLSIGLVKRLTRPELTAILAHEKQHLASWDPLRTFITVILSKLFFFVPAIKWLAQEVLLAQEIAADKAALNRVKRQTYLATILRVEQILTPPPANLGLGFGDLTNRRLHRLAGIPRNARFTQLTLTNIGQSLLVLALLTLMIILPIRAQSRTDLHYPPDPICRLEGTPQDCCQK